MKRKIKPFSLGNSTHWFITHYYDLRSW